MRARVGDLAIVRFDPTERAKQQGKKWDERVCIVTGCWSHLITKEPREYDIIYWYKIGNKLEIRSDVFPSHRLIRVRPKIFDQRGLRIEWDGDLRSLTLDNVEPVS